MTKHLFMGKVFFNEVDSGGVIYFANYLKILDNARTTYFNDLGFGYKEQEKERKLFAVTSLNVTYKKSLYLDESYTVITETKNIRHASLLLEQSILRNDVVVTLAELTLAYLDFNRNQKPTRIPLDRLPKLPGTP